MTGIRSVTHGPSHITCAVPWYSTSSLPFGLSDTVLVLITPLMVFWATAGFYAVLDGLKWGWIERYRIHESAVAASQNLASRSHVLRFVFLQQLYQTGFAYWWIEEQPVVAQAAHCLQVQHWTLSTSSILAHTFGPATAHALSLPLAYFAYWWCVPVVQLLLAMYVASHCLSLGLPMRRLVMDAWQYFLHRAMHRNHFLYKHVHSMHHRLYAPFSFGSMYNHPVEGFLLDILGSAVAETAAGLSPRQAALFFGFSTLKAVEDHSGYKLPWSPIQLVFANSSDYHDIHHQVRDLHSQDV
jgi:sphinganine C4-monooxygenase